MIEKLQILTFFSYSISSFFHIWKYSITRRSYSSRFTRDRLIHVTQDCINYSRSTGICLNYKICNVEYRDCIDRGMYNVKRSPTGRLITALTAVLTFKDILARRKFAQAFASGSETDTQSPLLGDFVTCSW